MWLYPLPPLLALAGFLFILASRPEARHECWLALIVGAVGSALYFARARMRREWPWQTGRVEG